jgi:hypothetical protein
MGHVVINYRREEASAYAGRLYDRLAREFGAEQVFMDIDTLEPGTDYVEAIQNAVNRCSAMVTVIGPDWTSAHDERGRRRLDNPTDWVRVEIAAALHGGVRVFPLLVGGAIMPVEEELPDELKALARRHALEVSDLRFHTDVDRLIKSLRRMIPNAERVSPGEDQSPRSTENVLDKVTSIPRPPDAGPEEQLGPASRESIAHRPEQVATRRPSRVPRWLIPALIRATLGAVIGAIVGAIMQPISVPTMALVLLILFAACPAPAGLRAKASART